MKYFCGEEGRLWWIHFTREGHANDQRRTKERKKELTGDKIYQETILHKVRIGERGFLMLMASKQWAPLSSSFKRPTWERRPPTQHKLRLNIPSLLRAFLATVRRNLQSYSSIAQVHLVNIYMWDRKVTVTDRRALLFRVALLIIVRVVWFQHVF